MDIIYVWCCLANRSRQEFRQPPIWISRHLQSAIVGDCLTAVQSPSESGNLQTAKQRGGQRRENLKPMPSG